MLSQRILRLERLKNACFRSCATAPTTAKAAPTQTPEALKRFIVDKIRATGPISVAEYMRLAIRAPVVGYYSGFAKDEKEVFGSKGDFVTSPELTSIFGELLGVWCYVELQNTGYQGPWALIENGPGTGQLMLDMLSSLRKLKAANFSVHLVETSAALIAEQELKLCGQNSGDTAESDAGYLRKNVTKEGIPVYWYNDVEDIPEQFSVFVSNEYLDALPIHQFKRNLSGKWSEIYVNIDPNNDLVFMESRGDNLHTRIRTNGGFCLMIDYGHDGDRKDFSLRAYSKHKLVNPLSAPGTVDLTADVNFGHLKSLVEDRVLTYGPQTQREFLGQLGIQVYLRSALHRLGTMEKQEQLLGACDFLMNEMGQKFKAVALFPKTLQEILEKRGGPTGFAGLDEKPVNQK
ncbi:unnamed protein product, partial [Mesorhabditis spiculigera]